MNIPGKHNLFSGIKSDCASVTKLTAFLIARSFKQENLITFDL